MGPAWLRAMPFIDLAATGEGDRVFPELLIERCAGRSGANVGGVLSRDADGRVVGAASAPIEDLDELPVPDYREYFSRAERLGLLPRSPVRDVELSFESARGCWWGAKRQCTFCGLNGSTIRFRSKSSARVLEEMAELSKAYGSFRLAAVDNILDLDYFGDVLDPLGAATSGYDIFYELKADVSREHIRRLRAAGVTRVQPGIESLSSPVLGLMRKGTRAHHNVNLLRWSAYYGVDVAWNLLYGFPGERVEHYVDQVALLDSLTHLQPPGGVARIHIERFSPIFEDHERFPIDELRPHRSYGATYPATVDMNDAAYLFEGHIRGALPDDVFEALHRSVARWRERRAETPSRPTLLASRGAGIVHVDDGRDPSDPVTYVFEDIVADAYLACFDRAQKASDVAATLGADVAEMETMLDAFCSRGLMLRDGNLFLALALPATPGR
jgi:ribosomal peptide maturation radical SAM protein 1